MVRIGIAAAIVAALAFGGSAHAAPALTPVSFVTDWKAQAEHGGFYEAVAMASTKSADSTCTSSKAGRA